MDSTEAADTLRAVLEDVMHLASGVDNGTNGLVRTRCGILVPINIIGFGGAQLLCTACGTWWEGELQKYGLKPRG